ALILLPSAAVAQTVSWYRFDPLTVPSTFNQAVSLEVAVAGGPTRVALAFNGGGTLDMRDDGTGGGTPAGRGRVPVPLPPPAVTPPLLPRDPIPRALRADDVQRYFVGFLDVFNGATRVLRGNMFVDVYTPDIGTFPIDRLAPDAQATARVLNIVDPSFLADGN